MRVLVLGGTAFLGRHLTEALLARGHQVTLFHRGLTAPGAFPEAEHVHGDRERDIGLLAGRRFDAVIDTSGYEVPAVRAAVEAVAHSGVHYVFISSASVYASLSRMDEDAPLQEAAGADTARLSLESYGALKAACERVVLAALPGRAHIVRAGLILGPHDYDLRFPWWLRRVARGGEVLAPGDPAAPVQLIDARDLAGWIVSSAERRLAGTFNATGPAAPLTMRSLLDTIHQVVGGDARFTWVGDEVLVAHQVAPYSEMPFWLPASLGHHPVDIRRALAAGLTHRPVADTVRDTWAWLTAGADSAENARAHRRLHVPAGLSPEREAELLAAARAHG
ncbi:MAG TPA: NAD-dependent epimerase/dehydratase family protein [Kofleriaceae bacterium]|nr:NAD-dependent epimerase/dehydratase family protein [Kofleriaceae bacterium]